MAALTWDAEGSRYFETGVDHGTLYVYGSNAYNDGVAWNGLSSISESPEGAEASDIYADNIKYLTLLSAENFKGTIEAYTYPDEFMACDGTAAFVGGMTIGQQSRKRFGLAYRTKVGNDTDGDSKGYKIHLVYGCFASPSEKQYQTVNDSPEAISFSWEFSTTPVTIGTIDGVEYKPTATVVLDSTKFSSSAATNLAVVEAVLFGSTAYKPTLLTPTEIYDILKDGSTKVPERANVGA